MESHQDAAPSVGEAGHPACSAGAEEDHVDLWLGNLEGAFENFGEEEEEGEDEQAGRGFKKKPWAQRVERIDYASITQDEFRERFLETNMPAILGNWDKIPALDVDYWLQKHPNMMVPLDVGTPQERVVRLGDFLSDLGSDQEGEEGQRALRTRYLRSIHTAEWFEKENAAIVYPEVFGKNHLADETREYPHSWRRWYELFISVRECSGFPFVHKDMCATHALSLQVQGIKRFFLFPPSDSPHLYAHGHTQSRSAIPHSDLVNDTVDPAAFPLYSHATMHIADIRAGDVFFCPSNWWHTTCVVSAEPSVTLGGNFVTDENLEEHASQWRDYLNMQAMASAGAAHIEHVAKRPLKKAETKG